MIRASKALILCGAALCLTALPACHRSPANEVTLPPAPAVGDTHTLDGTVLASFKGDAQAGARLFTRCSICHTLQSDGVMIGPSLAGIVGQPAARLTSFTHYSDAIRTSHIVWTPEKLYQFLENPRRVIPGTKMTFMGVPKPQDRAALIAWLATQ
jgi:cytochrome c